MLSTAITLPQTKESLIQTPGNSVSYSSVLIHTLLKDCWLNSMSMYIKTTWKSLLHWETNMHTCITGFHNYNELHETIQIITNSIAILYCETRLCCSFQASTAFTCFPSKLYIYCVVNDVTNQKQNPCQHVSNLFTWWQHCTRWGNFWWSNNLITNRQNENVLKSLLTRYEVRTWTCSWRTRASHFLPSLASWLFVHQWFFFVRESPVYQILNLSAPSYQMSEKYRTLLFSSV